MPVDARVGVGYTSKGSDNNILNSIGVASMERSKVVQQVSFVSKMEGMALSAYEAIGDMMAESASDDSTTVFTTDECDVYQQALVTASRSIHNVLSLMQQRKQLLHKTYHGSIDKVLAEPEELVNLQLDDDFVAVGIREAKPQRTR